MLDIISLSLSFLQLSKFRLCKFEKFVEALKRLIFLRYFFQQQPFQRDLAPIYTLCTLISETTPRPVLDKIVDPARLTGSPVPCWSVKDSRCVYYLRGRRSSALPPDQPRYKNLFLSKKHAEYNLYFHFLFFSFLFSPGTIIILLLHTSVTGQKRGGFSLLNSFFPCFSKVKTSSLCSIL